VVPALVLAAAAMTSPLATCPATTVHYGATRIGVPWIATSGLKGHLFAYRGSTLMDGRVNESDGLVLYTDGAMKILWAPERRAGSRLTLVGRRIGERDQFVQLFRADRTGRFPTTVKFRRSGCWRLSLQFRGWRSTVVANVVDPPAEPICEPTPVFRDVPHPRFGNVTWMAAIPRSSGIAAVRFVSTVPGAERAVIYAGGRAPEGWNTKFLWWSPKPTGPLVLAGRQLDGTGRFRQVEYGAWEPAMGLIFPSIVEIPNVGCWAVTVSTGNRAGVVLFQAVQGG
jgi:hypothetical protein